MRSTLHTQFQTNITYDYNQVHHRTLPWSFPWLPDCDMPRKILQIKVASPVTSPPISPRPRKFFGHCSWDVLRSCVACDKFWTCSKSRDAKRLLAIVEKSPAVVSQTPAHWAISGNLLRCNIAPQEIAQCEAGLRKEVNWLNYWK